MILKALKIGKIPIFALQANKDISKQAASILGAEMEPRTKVWYFPAYYPFGLKVFDEVKMLFGSNVYIDESVYAYLKSLYDKKTMLETKMLDEKFKFATEPMEHQIEGILYGITHLRLGIFWECGTGKSKTATDIIRYLRKNTLILCPSRLVKNMEEEIQRHSFSSEIETIPILGTRQDKMDLIKSAYEVKNKPIVTIIGYETATYIDETKDSQYHDLLKNINYDLMICDESHKLRSFKSNTSKVVMALAQKAYRRILMTGTPSLGNPLHLWVQMYILMPWLYKNYYAFDATFVQRATHDRKIIVGFKNLHTLRSQVNNFSIQKTKEECLDLPERNTIVCKINASGEQEELYRQVFSGNHSSVEYNPLAMLINMKLHQICGGTLVDSPIDYTLCNSCENMPRCVEHHTTPFSKNCIKKDTERPVNNIFIKDNPKLNYLIELLNTIVKGEGKKVIVWYSYENEKRIIKKTLKENGIKFVHYGEEGDSARVRFNEDKDIDVFLSQISSSSGITLNVAKYTIYYSLSWDLEHYLQSRDRNYRKGQLEKTTEYHLQMRGWVDEDIYDRLVLKKQVNYAMLKQKLDEELITKIRIK